jgi:hypothetical protein
MQIEKWLPIKDYEGLYEIGSFGNIKNHNTGRILKPAFNSRGYLHVTLSKNNIHKTTKIHNTVASHFIGNPENKPCVNHIDGIKKHNWRGNLEYCTHMENVHHAIKMGLKPSEVRGYLNPKSTAVYQMDMNSNIIADFGSMSDAQRKTGVSKGGIRYVCKGERCHAGGFTWKYKLD